MEIWYLALQMARQKGQTAPELTIWIVTKIGVSMRKGVVILYPWGSETSRTNLIPLSTTWITSNLHTRKELPKTTASISRIDRLNISNCYHCLKQKNTSNDCWNLKFEINIIRLKITYIPIAVGGTNLLMFNTQRYFNHLCAFSYFSYWIIHNFQ